MELKSGDDTILTQTKKVKLHNPISAIQELNKMDKVYEPDYNPPEVKIQTFVFILPDGTKVVPKELMSGNHD